MVYVPGSGRDDTDKVVTYNQWLLMQRYNSELFNDYHYGSISMSIDDLATPSASTQYRIFKQIKQGFLATP